MKKIFLLIMLISCGTAFVNASNIEEFEEFNYDNYKAMAGAFPDIRRFEYAEVTGLSFSKKHKAKRKFLEANICKNIDDIDPIGPNKGVVVLPPLLSFHYTFN